MSNIISPISVNNIDTNSDINNDINSNSFKNKRNDSLSISLSSPDKPRHKKNLSLNLNDINLNNLNNLNNNRRNTDINAINNNFSNDNLSQTSRSRTAAANNNIFFPQSNPNTTTNASLPTHGRKLSTMSNLSSTTSFGGEQLSTQTVIKIREMQKQHAQDISILNIDKQNLDDENQTLKKDIENQKEKVFKFILYFIILV